MTEKVIYHLGNCDTCREIIKELNPSSEVKMQDIKFDKITEKQLDAMKELAGSYEALFSRRSMKYRAWELNKKELTEADYKKYILEEYTFLKRPVIVSNGKIAIGNAKAAVDLAKEIL